MRHAAARPRPDPVWLLVVVAMIGMALAGPAGPTAMDRSALRPITGWDTTAGERSKYFEGS